MKLGVDITYFKGTGGGIIKVVQHLINACKKYYPDLEVVSFSGRFDLRNDFNFYISPIYGGSKETHYCAR